MKEYSVTIILKNGTQITDELIAVAAEVAESSKAEDNLIYCDEKNLMVAHEWRVDRNDDE